MTERKALISWINVMELEGRHASVVATDPTRPAGLLDEHLLYTPTPLAHSL